MTADIVKIVCCLVCVVMAIANASPPSMLPKGFQQCKKSDPNLNECLRSGLQSAIPHLSKGVPSLGIVPLDPLRITELAIDQGTGPVSIKLNFKDFDILNIHTAIINKLEYDPKKHSFYFDIITKKPIVLEGNYEISGKVLILPIVGKGKCKISLDVSKVYGTMLTKPVVKNGNTFLEVERLLLKFVASKINMKFDNLFNGDKALGDNMNVFLNENWREVVTELQPAIEEVFGVAFKGIVQEFFKRIPINHVIVY